MNPLPSETMTFAMLVPEVPRTENGNKPPPIADRGLCAGEGAARKGYNFEILFFDKVVDFNGIVKLDATLAGLPDGDARGSYSGESVLSKVQVPSLSNSRMVTEVTPPPGSTPKSKW